MVKKNIEKDKTKDAATNKKKKTARLKATVKKAVSIKAKTDKQVKPLLRDKASIPDQNAKDNQSELEIQNKELLGKQRELKKSLKLYINLYDQAAAGYFTLNTKGIITDANMTAASLFGVTKTDLRNKLFSLYVHPDDQKLFNHQITEFFRSGIKQIFEMRLKKNDLWVQMEMAPNSKSKKPESCRAMIIDISEQKRLEEQKHKFKEQIIQNQRLESLGIIAGGIAHNFNNLLTGIFGYIELAERKADNPDVSRYLTEALNMSERAKRLTEQLLTFSRGEPSVKKTGSLFPLIKDSVQFSLKGSEIGCHFNIQENLKQCSFDINQICQVIDDITLNARQSMPDGGIIEISADNILLHNCEVASLPEGNYVKITFKDTGAGISPEIISKIFDPFFTARTTGHGLGLAASNTIISRHGGAIVVESEHDRGNSVIIYLPSITESAEQRDKKTDPGHSGDGTIIIMDDEECIRDSLSEMLMSMGYDVIHMEAGEEVISFLKDEQNSTNDISGIILDLVIPGGMGGKAAVKEINRITPDIPVFAISGYSDDPVMLNPRDYGFTEGITKPFLMAKLSEMLNRYLKKVS